MKNYAKLLSLNLFALFGVNSGMVRADFQLPLEFKAILDAHPQEVDAIHNEFMENPAAQFECNIRNPEWANGQFFIKEGIERVKKCQEGQQIIDENNLDKLRVAPEYLYVLPGKKATPENMLVISKTAEGLIGPEQRLTATQAEQLALYAVDSGNADLHCKNFISMPDDVIAIIDHDEKAFASSRVALQNLIECNCDLRDTFPDEVCPKLKRILRNCSNLKLALKKVVDGKDVREIRNENIFYIFRDYMDQMKWVKSWRRYSLRNPECADLIVKTAGLALVAGAAYVGYQLYKKYFAPEKEPAAKRVEKDENLSFSAHDSNQAAAAA